MEGDNVLEFFCIPQDPYFVDGLGVVSPKFDRQPDAFAPPCRGMWRNHEDSTLSPTPSLR